METSPLASTDGPAIARERGRATVINTARSIGHAVPVPLLRAFVRYSYLPLRAAFFVSRPPSEPRPAIARTRKGFKMLVSTSNQLVDECIWWFGQWEPQITAVFERQLRQGDVCIDVGANIGYYSLLASRLVGKAGRVFAFEPGAAAAHILRLNVGLNRAHNVEVYRDAVSDSAGTMELHEHRSGQLGLIGPFEEGMVFSVPAVTLDEAVVVDPSRCRLLKVDVQGGELGVLHGANDLLKRAERICVVCEISHDGPEIFDLMAGHGFRPYHISWEYSSRELARLRTRVLPITPIDAPPAEETNILFTKDL